MASSPTTARNPNCSISRTQSSVPTTRSALMATSYSSQRTHLPRCGHVLMGQVLTFPRDVGPIRDPLGASLRAKTTQMPSKLRLWRCLRPSLGTGSQETRRAGSLGVPPPDRQQFATRTTGRPIATPRANAKREQSIKEPPAHCADRGGARTERPFRGQGRPTMPPPLVDESVYTELPSCDGRDNDDPHQPRHACASDSTGGRTSRDDRRDREQGAPSAPPGLHGARPCGRAHRRRDGLARC